MCIGMMHYFGVYINPNNLFVCIFFQTFKIWKEEKDIEIKEKLKKKREEEREKKDAEDEVKRAKERENQTALRGW